jgi:hypothetical protein
VSEKRYIHIRNWDRYQHPDTRRGERPMAWIKDFTSQIHELAYRQLTFAERGLLHSLREMYALNRRDGIEIAQGSLHSLLGQRVTNVQLERLNHAGFIEFSASKTLASCKQAASTDKDIDKEEDRDQELDQEQNPSIHPSSRTPRDNGARKTDGWMDETNRITTADLPEALRR